MKMETCYGCDALAARHPWIGIMHFQDVEQTTALIDPTPNRKGFVKVTVCEKCFVEPDTAKRVINAHFFQRTESDRGLSEAGSSSQIGG